MKVIAVKEYMKKGREYKFIDGSYEAINTDNERFINFDIHFRKKDWYICSIEAMTSLLLNDIVDKKFYKSSRILRINVINNYNETKTFIVYYNNRFKREYLVKG